MTQAVAATRSFRWPLIVAGALLGHASFMVLVAVIASGDPSHAVEPNHYDKALAWDSHRETLLAAERDGLRIEPRVESETTGLRRQQIVVTLRDAAGNACNPTALRGELFHHARAADRQSLTFSQDENGQWVSKCDMQRVGAWELRVWCTLDGTDYAWIQTLMHAGAQGG